MNKRQKEVMQRQLDSEKAVLEELEKQYRKALRDIERRIRILESDDLTQSRIYRLEYQKALKQQVQAILERLHADEYSTIQQFLSAAYTDGFLGTVYDMHGQGVPLIFPIDPKEAVAAVMTESKLSIPLYEALGVDTKKLSKTISSEISRGIASSMAHTDIVRNIANASKAPLSRAKTIVQTETHRIQEKAALDALYKAKSRGADMVKQWNSTLDGDTRTTHRKLDGQVREVDEPFEANGKKAMYPGGFGDPAEDCNCRCRIFSRARLMMDENELQILKERAEFFGIDKTEDFEEFKEKYIKSVEMLEKNPKSGIITPRNKTQSGAVSGAYNNRNDPDGTKRDEHAERYYSTLRNSSKKSIVYAIAQNAQVDEKTVGKVYDHLLVNKYDLDKGYTNFDPDYDIAQSLQRLRDGKDIQAHDLILLQHEALEYDLMNRDGMSYEAAHAKANERYNYQKALENWLDALEGD